jgi:hypothetical protein
LMTIGAVELAVGGRRDMRLVADLLGETLRSLELRCSLGRPEAEEPRRPHVVAKPGHCRRIRSDHDEVDGVRLGEGHHRIMLGDVDFGIFGDLPRAAVTRRHEQLFDAP